MSLSYDNLYMANAKAHDSCHSLCILVLHGRLHRELCIFHQTSPTHSTFRRKRAVGIRPRTLNFYCELENVWAGNVLFNNFWIDWLPNHMLVVHVLLLFSVFNPFVIPFGALYFFVQSGQSMRQLTMDFTNS